ncbi:MAG: hypothetical protein K8R87_04860 [Verrucomicrobia bacterium]|nr:hypothetical protein [Verrucomicrobiota bacterium]
MKTKIAALFLVAVAMLNSACEKHKWSETQQLFKQGEHGEAKGEHSEAASHGDAKSAEPKH